MHFQKQINDSAVMKRNTNGRLENVLTSALPVRGWRKETVLVDVQFVFLAGPTLC